MAYKFEISAAKTGLKFNLVAPNGESIASSQVYASKSACKNGIASVKKIAAVAAIEDQTKEGFVAAKNPKFELYKDKAGEFRFRLKAKNGQVILSSEGYAGGTKAALNSVKSVVKNAPTAKVVEAKA